MCLECSQIVCLECVWDALRLQMVHLGQEHQQSDAESVSVHRTKRLHDGCPSYSWRFDLGYRVVNKHIKKKHLNVMEIPKETTYKTLRLKAQDGKRQPM